MKLDQIVKNMLAHAATDVWTGRDMTPYFAKCKFLDYKRGISILFSRDTGHHTSGWWKNPDYERCFHLSLSFFDPDTQEPRMRDAKLTKQLVDAFYGVNRRWLWCEPPYSDNGKRLDVWHYRLFCDPGWQPIKPRGEVYDRELTEAGWKSFSDVQHQLEIEEKALAEIRGNQ